jgi:hypothetical protein
MRRAARRQAAERTAAGRSGAGRRAAAGWIARSPRARRKAAWTARRAAARRATILGALLATVLLAPGAATAQDDPLVTDRPDFTESATTVAPGRFQLEGGVTFTDAGATDELAVGELLGRLGLTDRLELRLGAPSYLEVDAPGAAGADGFDDASLGLKARLWPAGAGGRPEAALIVATSLPTGDEEVGGGDALVPEAVLALAWELAPDLGLGVNLGAASPRDGGDRYAQAFASAALGWAATDRLGLFAELYGFSEEHDGGDPTAYADAGATWSLGPDHQLDARLGTGLSGTEVDWFVGVGFAVRW